MDKRRERNQASTFGAFFLFIPSEIEWFRVSRRCPGCKKLVAMRAKMIIIPSRKLNRFWLADEGRGGRDAKVSFCSRRDDGEKIGF